MKSYIGIDFDGTCVTHEYPLVGETLPNCVETLRQLCASGHQLILWTMRSGEQLDEAVEWFTKHDIRLFGVNQNPTQKRWTESPKAYCHLYIDDAALGMPLVQVERKRPAVDWVEVEKLLEVGGFFD